MIDKLWFKYILTLMRQCYFSYIASHARAWYFLLLISMVFVLFMYTTISSSEPKAQVRCYDRKLYVVCRRCCIFFSFLSSSEPLRQFQPNFVQHILEWEEFKFVQMKDSSLFQEEIMENNENSINYFFLFSNLTLLYQF